MDAVRLADSPPGPHKQPSSPAPWARLALVLGVLSLLVFWVAFYQILTHSDWYFLREWGLFIAFLLGLMSLAAHGMGQAVTSNGMAPPEHSDGTTPSGHSAMAAPGAVVSLARHHSDKGNRGYGCLIGGFVGSVFLAGVIFMLVFGGSRTRAIEKFMNSNVAEVASMLAGTLDELKEAPASRRTGLPRSIYADTAEGNSQLAVDAVQILLNKPFITESRNPYGSGPAFLAGPPGRQLGTIYLDTTPAKKSRGQNPEILVTGVFKRRDGSEDHCTKRVPVS